MKPKAITPKNASYPPLLAEIPSPPAKLFYYGRLPTSDHCVAIVGSRKLTAYGRAVTQRIAGDLAGAGLTIVSGLAFGIDSVAHAAALEAKGRTVAFLACGLDQIYPAANRPLARRILAGQGAIISEYPAGVAPFKQNFVARNRLISGLSLAVIVTEAPEKSGALITANFALEQNRLVMSVPGNITARSSAGANNLLKAGAIAVTEARDVLTALDLEVPTLKAKIAKPASREEAAILELLAQEVSDSEDLIAQSGFDAIRFNQVITLMEISGKVRNLGSGKWIAN